MVVIQKVQSKAKHAAHLPSEDNKEKESTWLEHLEKNLLEVLSNGFPY